MAGIFYYPLLSQHVLSHPTGGMVAYLVACHRDMSVLTLPLNPDIHKNVYRTMHSSTKKPLHHNNMTNGYKILVTSWSKDSQVTATNLTGNQYVSRIFASCQDNIPSHNCNTSFAYYWINSLLPAK